MLCTTTGSVMIDAAVIAIMQPLYFLFCQGLGIFEPNAHALWFGISSVHVVNGFHMA